MIHAYDEVYLDKARSALGRMLDFAVHDMHYTLSDFFRMFLSSSLSIRFAKGDYALLVGMSGVELAYTVLDDRNLSYERIAPTFTLNRSEEYWTGWALAYYQWYTDCSFSEIDRYTSIEEIQAMYTPYHEMDIRQFVDELNRRYRVAHPDTRLKERRLQGRLSQSTLADLSGVPLRTIQQYEQRQKNINHAKAVYLVQLAKTLRCDVVDLMEQVE